MDLRIEMVGDRVICRQDGARAFDASLSDFLSTLAERADRVALPEPIPDGVRFIRQCGETVILVLEEQPQVRTVRWLRDGKSAPFGRGAVYETVRLAFPFVVTIVAFRDGGLTGHQQCFYRTEPLTRIADPLLLPNLYNVANGYGQQCWLCLANLQIDLRPRPWHDKVREIRRHMWGAGFNRSSEVHEGMSYWGVMRTLDRRIATLEAWQQATRDDRFFPLKVPWKPAGTTAADVMNGMMASLNPFHATTVTQLVQLLSVVNARGAKHKSV